MYSVLIGVNILLGFFLTFYQSLIGSHKFDLLNGSNEDIAKKEIIKEYYGNRRWILVLATVSGEVWTRVSHALVLVSKGAFLCTGTVLRLIFRFLYST